MLICPPGLHVLRCAFLRVCSVIARFYGAILPEMPDFQAKRASGAVFQSSGLIAVGCGFPVLCGAENVENVATRARGVTKLRKCWGLC